MTFKAEQIEALSAPLFKGNVKKNPRGFDYVEGWHAIAEANRIFGFDGWDRRILRLEETNRELVELSGGNGKYKQWRVGFLATVEITVGGVTRQGTGFGTGMAKPEALGEAIESASKESETDAMKRALMTFGNPFGLALYDKDKANVAAEPGALEIATGLLRGSADRSGEDFKAAWEKNKDGWKDLLSAADYRTLVATMRDLATRFSKPEAKGFDRVTDDDAAALTGAK